MGGWESICWGTCSCGGGMDQPIFCLKRRARSHWDARSGLQPRYGKNPSLMWASWGFSALRWVWEMLWYSLVQCGKTLGLLCWLVQSREPEPQWLLEMSFRLHFHWKAFWKPRKMWMSLGLYLWIKTVRGQQGSLILSSSFYVTK